MLIRCCWSSNQALEPHMAELKTVLFISFSHDDPTSLFFFFFFGSHLSHCQSMFTTFLVISFASARHTKAKFQLFLGLVYIHSGWVRFLTVPTVLQWFCLFYPTYTRLALKKMSSKVLLRQPAVLVDVT